MPLHDCLLVQFEKRSGDVLENRQVQQLRGIEHISLAELGADDSLIGERARGAGDHALAAGDAGGFAHGQVVIEGDAGLISLATTRQHPVVPYVVAAANATVTENAGFVIDRNDGGGIVLAAGVSAMRETRLLDASDAGEVLQFAVSRLLLASTRRRMVRHEQLDQGVTRSSHLIGRGLHRHAGFNLTNTGRGIHTLADVDYADAAYAHRIFVLLVAEGWDWNPMEAGSIENGGSRRNRHGHAVNGELNLGGGLGTHAVPPCGKQTPAGQRRLVRCSSTTSRKCFSTDAIGTGTTWPSPQIEVNFKAWVSSSSNCRSAFEPWPSVHPVSISTSFCDPTRQGTHLPQDSLR